LYIWPEKRRKSPISTGFGKIILPAGGAVGRIRLYPGRRHPAERRNNAAGPASVHGGYFFFLTGLI
jgi:hypothetical protein